MNKYMIAFAVMLMISLQTNTVPLWPAIRTVMAFSVIHKNYVQEQTGTALSQIIYGDPVCTHRSGFDLNEACLVAHAQFCDGKMQDEKPIDCFWSCYGYLQNKCKEKGMNLSQDGSWCFVCK